MSDVSGPYDPNAIEGEKPAGAQYISAKDLKVWVIVIALLSVPIFFIYKVLQGNSERHLCISNLRAVYQAINFYADQHDNRFPPLARTEADGVTPSLSEAGTPYTWVSDVAPFMSARQSFLCPSAQPAERVHNESGDSPKKSIVSSYGMYAPYAGVLTSLVESPDQVVIVAETSDQGSRETLDTKPYGSGLADGFSIGWNDTNSNPGTTTTSVSRLAFPGSGKGTTKEGRHGKFLQGLSASGELLQLVPDDATYHLGGVGGINPHWKLPPGYRPTGH